MSNSATFTSLTLEVENQGSLMPGQTLVASASYSDMDGASGEPIFYWRSGQAFETAEVIYEGPGRDRFILNETDVGNYIWVNVGFNDDLSNLEYNPNPTQSSLVQTNDDFVFFEDRTDYSISSGNPQIDSLLFPDQINDDQQIGYNLNGFVFGNNTIDYTFQLSDVTDYGFVPIDYSIENELNSLQQDSIRDVLQLASNATGIQFEEANADDEPELYFYFADLSNWDQDLNTLGLSQTAYNGFIDVNNRTRDIDLDSYIIFDNQFLSSEFNPGSQEFFVALHEIGHFLSLDHPHENTILDPRLDTDVHSVMSYNFRTNGEYQEDFAPLDKVALNYLYGGDGINGEFGVYTTSILDLNPGPDFILDTTGYLNSGELFSWNEVISRPLEDWVDLSYEGQPGSTLSAAVSFSEPSNSNASLIEPTYTWYSRAYSNSVGDFVNAVLQEESSDPNYTILDSDIGKALFFNVTYFDDQYNEVVSDDSQSLVIGRSIDDPLNTRAEFTQNIDGAFMVGSTLLASSDATDSDGIISGFTNYWYTYDDVSGDYILLAEGDQYTLSENELGEQIYLRTTFTDGIRTYEYSDYYSTGETVQPFNSPAVLNKAEIFVDNEGNYEVGQVLVADIEYFDADGMTSSNLYYRWYGGEPTDSDNLNLLYEGYGYDRFVINEAEIGKTIYVSAGFYDDSGNWESSGYVYPTIIPISPNENAFVLSLDQIEEALPGNNTFVNAMIHGNYIYPGDTIIQREIDSVDANWITGNNTVDYVFVEPTNSNSGFELNGYSVFQSLDSAQRDAVRSVLEKAQDATGIIFQEASSEDEAELYFYFSDLDNTDSSLELIHQMYIAFLQRPADPEGLVYWQTQLDAYGGGVEGWDKIATAFKNGLEADLLYGNQTIGEQVSNIYLAAFERAASAEEIEFWEASGFEAEQIAFAIVNGAQNDDLATIQKKTEYAKTFVSILDPSGSGIGPFAFDYEDWSQGRTLMDSITKDSDISELEVLSQMQSLLIESKDSDNFLTFDENGVAWFPLFPEYDYTTSLDPGANTFTSFDYTTDAQNVIRNTDLDSFVIFDDAFISSDFSSGSLEYETVLREVGNFLGLTKAQYIDDGDWIINSNKHTVMTTYNDGTYSTDFGPLDKVALEFLYGSDGIGNEFGVNGTVTLPFGGTFTLPPNSPAVFDEFDLISDSLDGTEYSLLKDFYFGPPEVHESGAFVVGSTIRMTPASFTDPDGISLASESLIYRWSDSFYTAFSSPQDYTIQATDIGTNLGYWVGFLDDNYNSEYQRTDSFGVTIFRQSEDPQNSPAEFVNEILGDMVEGQTLTAQGTVTDENQFFYDTDGDGHAVELSTSGEPYNFAWYSAPLDFQSTNDFNFLGYGDTYTLTSEEIGSLIYTRSIINDQIHTLEISDHFTTGAVVKKANVSAQFDASNELSLLINHELRAGYEVSPVINFADENGIGISEPNYYFYHSDNLETPIHSGTYFDRYVFSESDIGKQISIRMEFVDGDDYLEVSPLYELVDISGEALIVQPPIFIDTEMLIDNVLQVGENHLEPNFHLKDIKANVGDYAYVDRSFGGAVVYDADGGISNIDFAGNENTFILDASSEFDFFGFSYDPSYTDDSEVVVLQGSVGEGTRSIEFGESTDAAEDWDVVSFDGMSIPVSIDLEKLDHNFDVTVKNFSDVIVAYVDGAEGVFGTSFSDFIAGDSGRNILHGGGGNDAIFGRDGSDLISTGKGDDSLQIATHDFAYGGAGEDVLIGFGNNVAQLFGDSYGVGETFGNRANDTFVVGQGTTIQDFDLSPDGAGLSGRSNQINDVVFVQVTAASLAAAGFTLTEIYELVSGDEQYTDQWRSFVRDLEVEVVPDETTGNAYNEIRLLIDGDGDGQATDIGTVSFLEAGSGSGNYNAVKMKTKLDEVLAQFESTTSDNAHVLEQFFGMDTLTATQLTALDGAVDAGKDAEAAGGDTVAVIAAIDAELVSETFDAAQAVRDALSSQMGAATTSEVIAAVEEVIDDAVDEALAATDMDTSLFVPVAVEEIREGTVRTEVIEDRDAAIAQIEALAQTDQQAADALREDLLTVTTIVDRTPEVADEPAPEAIIVLSNADDKVISAAGADDRFEVIPQVYVDSSGDAYDDDRKTDQEVAEQEQSFGKNVIVDLDARDDGASDGGGSTGGGVIDPNAFGDVVYLEGVSGIDGVNFERFQVGREGENSLKISATVTAQDVDENGNTVEIARNAGEVTVFKQFDALTDRFAVETLEISTTDGTIEYWSLSTAEADRSGGRITDTHIVTDVSNTSKGILIGSDTETDTYVVTGDGDAAQIKVVGFDSSDTINLTSFGEDLTTSVHGSDVEVSDANGIVVTLIGLGNADSSIDEQLIGVQKV